MEDSITAKELAKQKIDGVALRKPFSDLLGEIELFAIGLIWGPEYSGKSTFALALANAMADFGRIEYVPAEEDFGYTLTKKINQLQAYKLNFKRYRGLPDLRTWAENVKPAVVFIDSITVLNDANDKEVIDFAGWCRKNKIGFWMVVHANKDGSFKGSSSLGHEPDIKVEVFQDGSEDTGDDGEPSGKISTPRIARTTKNRYNDLASITVPNTAKKAGKGRKKPGKKAKKRPPKNGKASRSTEFDSTMNEVEQLLTI